MMNDQIPTSDIDENDVYLERYGKEYQDALAKRFADEFPDVYPEGFSDSFLCPPGWIGLLEETSQKLSEYLKSNPNLRSDIWGIKEKYGELRFVTSLRVKDEGFRKIINQAERESYKICEQCGRAGILRHGSWWRTLCEPHAGGRLPQVELFKGDEELYTWAKNWKGF